MGREREVLEGILRAEQQEERDVLRRCDWESPDDVAALRSSDRLKQRLRAIERVAPQRRCPSCGDIVLKSRSWVLKNDGTSAVCRSCFFRLRSREGREVSIESHLISSHTMRYTIEPHVLVLARHAANMSQAEMARRAGWSRSYHRKLESGARLSLSGENVQTILAVLREAGVTLLDDGI